LREGGREGRGDAGGAREDGRDDREGGREGRGDAEGTRDGVKESMTFSFEVTREESKGVKDKGLSGRYS
jgi:hypothetical protein